MAYTIVGTAIGSASEVAADMCRVSGYIIDIHGDALVSQELKVRNIAMPMAVGASTIVLQELQQIRSDSDGYVEFDLYQGSTVRVEIPGRETDLIRTMAVPEEDTIDLVAWLFPYITEISFDDGATYSADVDEQFTLEITTTLSNGEEPASSIAAALEISIDDESVLEHVSGLTFLALSTGTAVITIDDVDTDDIDEYQEPDGDVIERLQHPTITFDSITVTVS
tara:strand:- start:261 stop:932 length:672 start_codon:yes stop_codon:yes gene_type:complete